MYDEQCECCNKEVTISGAYIGSFSGVFCEDCGYESEYCNSECEKEE